MLKRMFRIAIKVSQQDPYAMPQNYVLLLLRICQGLAQKLLNENKPPDVIEALSGN